MARVLICGSRDFSDEEAILKRLRRRPDIDTVISGGARGADALAGSAAKALGLELLVYEADWQRQGKRAGPLRNQRMLDEGRPDEVWAFPLPGSRGTWDMVNRARSAGVPVEVIGDK